MSNSNIDTKALEALRAGNANLFDHVWLSDLLIVCGTESWKCHKSILCVQSEYFKKACGDGRFKEGAENRIELHDDDPFTVEIMLRFLYECRYHVSYAKVNDTNISQRHVKVFALADKYMLETLKIQAAEQFVKDSSAYWRKEFADAVSDAFATTQNTETSQLWLAIRDIVFKNFKALICPKDEANRAFQDMVDSEPEMLNHFVDGYVEWLHAEESKLQLVKCQYERCQVSLRAPLGSNVAFYCAECKQNLEA